MKSSVFLTAAALCIGSSAAFTAPTTPNARSATSLSMANNSESNNGKTFAASALAAAYLLTGVVSTDVAFAMDAFDSPSSHNSFADSSSVVISARSGGRAGGRAPSRAAPRRVAAPAASSSTTRVINRSTTIMAPPVIVGGGGYGYGYGGYGYDPTLSIGLSAVSAIGNGMREYRQTSEIAQSRAELSAAQEREREMGERIRALEQMQMQQNGQQPQAIYYAQPPVQQQQMAPASAQ
eukprot:g1362.t1 g1362   contig10:1929426-1930136(+)